MKKEYEAPVAEVTDFAAMENIALIEEKEPRGPITEGNQSQIEG